MTKPIWQVAAELRARIPREDWRELDCGSVAPGDLAGALQDRIRRLEQVSAALEQANNCGCGHHTIEPGADPYAAHRASIGFWFDGTRETGCEHDYAAIDYLDGIGISREQPEILVQIQDESGDGL